MAKILVVDDEQEKRRNIVEFMNRFGHDVTEAVSGDEGVRVLAEARGRFDIIIVDYSMPGMNGKEFVQYVRGMWKNGPRPTFVMLSGTLPDDIPDFAVQAPVANWSTFNQIITAAAAVRTNE